MEVSSSPGTVALAPFLVAFSERDAFCFPQLCVQSTTEHLVQQMGSARTWNSHQQIQSVLPLLLHEFS